MLSAFVVGEILVVGTALCIVGYAIAFLTSTHQIPIAFTQVVTITNVSGQYHIYQESGGGGGVWGVCVCMCVSVYVHAHKTPPI